MKHLRRSFKQTPEYPEANFFLGYSYFGQNLFEKAIEMFQKELAANPKYRRAHYYSGLAFESLNRIGDAIREFEILLKDDPADTKVLYQLARIHKASSMTAIKQLSHVAPDSVFFHVLRAESYMEDEKYPEAIKEYKLVSAMDPAFPGVHLGFGQIYYKQVNPTESEKEFRLALSRGRQPSHGQLLSGRVVAARTEASRGHSPLAHLDRWQSGIRRCLLSVGQVLCRYRTAAGSS